MKRLLPLLPLLLVLITSATFAQYYSVDDACGTSLEDISGTGTALGLSDDGEVLVTMPFAFTLYDITSADLEIDNNGGIVFNTTGAGNVTCCDESGLPNSNFTSAILPFWDDLDSETGDVYYQTLGTAPNRRFIVQWDDRPHFPGPGVSGVTFQVVLYETSNEIRFVYDDLDFGDPTFDDGVSATIGLQKDGSTADMYSLNSSIAGVGCILFTTVAPSCQDLTVQLDGSGSYSLATGSTTPQVDAEQTVPAGTFTGNMGWQSFTAGNDGVLQSVSLTFGSAYSPATSATVSIYSGEGTGGSLLTQLTYNNPISFASGTPTEFVLDNTMDLVAGNQYTVVIVDGSAGPIVIQKNDGDPYAGGRNNTSATSDFVFSTKLLQRPDIDNGSLDDTYGLASFDVDVATFNCSNIGANTVTLTVTNNAGGSLSCTSTVTVEDNEIPVASCQDIPVDLDGSGIATIAATDIDNGSSDNCTLTLSLDVTGFDCTDVGPNTVILTVEDPDGNTDNCSATVTVNDNTNPDAQCQNHTLVLDGSGSATLTVGDINNGSSDNCGLSTMTLSQTAFNCGHLGANTVTLTVNDVNGNSSNCTATVTVEDNQTPSIACPSDIVECAVDASGVSVDYASVTGSDNCTFTIAQTDASGLTDGDVFPVGTTTQEWTIEDIAGNTNSCSFTITVDPKPVADYSASPACQGETTFFTDLSTIDASSAIASWQWDMNDGSSLIGLVDPSHVFADTGVYNVELVVTSTEGCTDTATQAIHVGPVPTASFTVSNACEGNITSFTNTSTIDAGPLTYSWNFGDGNTSTDQDPDHTYATDGTYTVTLTVTSDNGCEDMATASVEVFAAPTALFSASEECEGTATQFTNLSTGAGITGYAWDFGDGNTSTQSSPAHTYAAGGNYSAVLTVTNANGCTDSYTVSVVVNALPTVDFSFSDVCEGTPVSFTNNSTSGSYAWDFGNQSSSTLANPTITYNTFGTYDVELTVTDANFCINSATQQIEIYDLPDFSLNPTDVACYGEASGSIEVDALGSPTPPWSYSLNNGTPQISDVFNGIPSGNYDVTVVDGNGCEFTLSTVVSQPSDTLGIEINGLTDILCHGEASGEINIIGTGGTSSYMYSIDAGSQQPTGNFSGLSAGSHDIQIVDANACVFDTTIILSEPDTLVLGLVNAADLLCNGDNSGNLEVSGTGGVGPYEYNLDGGLYGMSGEFNGLSAATYIVGVRDANGCEDTLHVTLTEPGILMLSLLNSEDANCFGESNGLIEVGAASGTPSYQYSLDETNYLGSGLFEGLGSGTYTVYVRDNNGCLDSITETIFEPALLTIETNSVPVACFGQSTGEIEIIATGGTPGPVLGYMFSINGGGSFVTNGGSFTDLATGNYLAVVSDTNGCTASEGVIISQPSAAFDLTANVTDALCLDSASGSVILLGSGGTPTYSYSSDNVSFGSDNMFDGFAAGSYTLYGQDVNGCIDSVQFNVSEPATAVNITSILLNNPACPNQASGTATVQVSGGTPSYIYSGNAGNTFQSSQILTGLNGGNHLVVVQDANGCTDTDTITLTSPQIFDFVVDSIVGVNCEGDFEGEIHVTAEGGTPSYNYTLNGGSLQSNGDYTNLTDGDYTISIMDVNGCTYSESFTVPAAQLQPVADFSFTYSGTAVLFNNNSENGSSYLWEFGDDSTSTEESPVHVYAVDGDYTVTLTVTNECGSAESTALVSTTTIGINDAEEANFSLYPIPASTVLNLRSLNTIDELLTVDIISMSGQVVRSTQFRNINSAGVVNIDINGLSNGVYHLRLVSAKQQSVLRFDIIK